MEMVLVEQLLLSVGVVAVQMLHEVDGSKSKAGIRWLLGWYLFFAAFFILFHFFQLSLSFFLLTFSLCFELFCFHLSLLFNEPVSLFFCFGVSRNNRL